MSQTPDFYRHHRGGSGRVVITVAINNQHEETRTGVFSSLDEAMRWAVDLGDEWVCVHSPYVVDDPDFGNRVVN